MQNILKNHWLLAILAFLGVSIFFHFITPNLADSDSFFYMRLASLYPERGIFNVDFPWTQFATIKTHSASLWYGFTVLLIPFSLFANPFLGIKIAGVIFTTLALAIFYFVIKRHKFKAALLWPFLLLFSAPNILYRFFMVRPQLVSVSLSVLLFSFLLNGGLIPIFLLSFAIAWIHMNFFWLPILLLVTVVGLKFLLERKIEWAKIGAVLGGVLLGIFARPNPLGALKLAYIQIFQQIFERQSGLPLLFGQEHYPLLLNTLLRNFSVFAILWVVAMVIFILSSNKKVPMWSGLALSVIFFLLTMFVARRAYDLWLPFGTLFIAAAYTYTLPQLSGKIRKISEQFFNAALPIAIIFLVVYSGSKIINELKEGAYKPERLKEVSLWLGNNSNPGDIVFNLRWSQFSELFFWNQKNYYISGLDPIFQYSYNPALYWKYHYLAIDQVTKKTCGALECNREQLEDTHDYLKNELGAKYALVEKRENEAVNFYMSITPNQYEKKFETAGEVVYLIK